MTPHLSLKNACGLVAGVCIVILAVVTILIPAETLAAVPWRRTVFGLAVLAVITLAAQMVRQSHEDQNVGKMLQALLGQRGMPPAGEILPQRELGPPEVKHALGDIDGELYRIVMSPRTFAWELIRDIFRMKGRPDDASVDCDILMEMYLVNRSKTETRYVRDIRLSVEVKGKRIELERQDDLLGMEFNGQQFEYGMKQTPEGQTDPMKPLYSTLPIALLPEQPIQGWVRFLASDINPENIDDKTWVIVAVDSVGTEHPITKAASGKRKGEIALRRLRS
jgi:hypothetical protein